MNTYTPEQTAQVFSWLRAMSPESTLTQAQVMAGDAIIAASGLDTFAAVIGFDLQRSATFATTGQLNISEKGYAIIRQFEGLRLKAYKDGGGVWTIGYGTIKYPNGQAVKSGDTCTEAQAEQWLKSDCKWVDACLDKYVTATINQNQFDALASFVYNIGESQFRTSTLLKMLNAGSFALAASNFDRWIYDNGKVEKGLVSRRAMEKKLFLS